eukprot:Em0003g1826a
MEAPPDIRPIAVGESLRRLTGKCICALVKDKASDLFQPLQLGVACSSGSEKIIHGLRKSIEDYWMEEDIVVFKIDMQNAFNLVSRQAVLDEYATSFPEILPSVTWCYGTRSLLWHQLGHYSLETGKGDFLGPLLFSLAWYLDDGVLTGKCSALLRALSLIEELGPSLGIHINLAKCELFIHFGNSMFPPAVKFSHHPNLEILGASIGDYLYCSNFIAGKSADARKLLSSLVDVAAVDPHVALSLLRLCGSYCRLVHLARATPSSLAGSLKLFDEEVRSNADNVHLQQAIIQFNDQVSTSDAITAEAGLPLWQTELAYYLFRLPMTPSLALGLHLEPNELHASIRKPWIHLGTILPHALMEAHMGVTVEAGYGLTHDNSRSRPADVLVTRWEKGLPAALNITVTSPLNPAILDESCSIAGAAAVAAESRKHVANDPKCFELGWTCVPLAVETYGNWGVEAQETFSRLASLLAAGHSVSKSKATADIYVRLNLTLTRYAGFIEDGTCEDYFYLMVCRFQTCEAFNQVNRYAGSIEDGTCEDYFYLMVCRFQTCEAFNQVNRSIDVLWTLRSLQASPLYAGSIEDGTCEDYFYLMVCRFQTCEAFNQVNRSIDVLWTLRSLQASPLYAGFKPAKPSIKYAGSIEDGTCEDYFYLMVCRFQTCEAFNQVNRFIEDGTCEDYFYLMRPLSLYPLFEVNPRGIKEGSWQDVPLCSHEDPVLVTAVQPSESVQQEFPPSLYYTARREKSETWVCGHGYLGPTVQIRSQLDITNNGEAALDSGTNVVAVTLFKRNESRVPENLDNAEPWAHQESKEPQGERQPMVTKAAGTSGIPGYRGQLGQKGDPLVLHVLLQQPVPSRLTTTPGRHYSIHNTGQERFNFGRLWWRKHRQGLTISCTNGPVISSEFTPLYDQWNSHHSTISELTPLYKQRAHTTLRPASSYHFTISELIPANSHHTTTHTTLRHSNFNHNLHLHPDKAWVTWLLDGIGIH